MTQDPFAPAPSQPVSRFAQPTPFRTWVGAAVALLAVLIAMSRVRAALGRGLMLLATGQLAQFQQYLLSLGAWAPLASIGLMILEALAIPVPVTLLIVANGLAFGPLRGALVSVAGGMTGALIAYAIGRWVGRPLLERIVNLQWAEALMMKYGKWGIVLERWIPGVPGDPVSYVAGISRVPAPTFLGLTMIGLVPADLVAACLGSQLAGDVPLRYWVSGLLVASLSYVAWRIARHR